jgi:hypothetical protein
MLVLIRYDFWLDGFTCAPQLSQSECLYWLDMTFWLDGFNDILKCESVHLYLETLQMLRNECLHSKSVNSDMKYYIVHNIAQNFTIVPIRMLVLIRYDVLIGWFYLCSTIVPIRMLVLIIYDVLIGWFYLCSTIVPIRMLVLIRYDAIQSERHV